MQQVYILLILIRRQPVTIDFPGNLLYPSRLPLLLGALLTYVNRDIRSAVARIAEICEFLLTTITFILIRPPAKSAPMTKKSIFKNFSHCFSFGKFT